MKKSREKAALVVAAFLAVAALCALMAYIFLASHSLNVAASTIDEATGSLDGYTALIYEGTAESRRESVVDTQTVKNGVLSQTAVSKKTAKHGNQQSNGNEVSASQAASSSESAEGQQRPVSLFSMRASYVEKQASVVTVNLANPQAYNERTVVRASGRTFGFVYIDEVTAHASYLKKRIADYKKCGVDVVVCVTKEISLLPSYPGVSIVISQKDEGLSSNGALVDGVFYDDAALRGQVGTILVSPSRTITAKDISSL